MKLLRQAMAWLHTWGGLLFGWPLFAICLTGSLAMFDQEIDYWMQPELQAHRVAPALAAEQALAYLQREQPTAKTWTISLPTERTPGLWAASGGRGASAQALDPRTGKALLVRETAGGEFFFRFHFTLNLPRAISGALICLIGMAMFAALVSGIVIHKKFFKEFFTFRPAKGARSWLDAHNVTGVLVLPFHLMISYSGVLIFALYYMPAAVQALYKGDADAFYEELYTPGVLPEASPVVPSHLRSAPLAPLLVLAQREMGPIGSIGIERPGQADARIEVRRVLGNRIALTKGQNMAFDGVSGQLLSPPPQMRASVLTQRVLFGLHFAQFGGYPVRWLYFFCGLASCAMIGSGLLLFSHKRRRQARQMSPGAARGHRLVEGLNTAVMAGLVLACISLLWANRLLPAQLPGRVEWELQVFFGVWALSLLHALWRPYRRAWSEQLWLAAGLCSGVVLLDSATAVHSPWTAWGQGDGLRAWLDLSALAIGAALAAIAWRVQRAAPTPAPARTARGGVQPC
ncbi:MAG: PepSY-associated TM helix domain-containing protein [Pseudomonas sp.]|uniref:PepSY-associated TM helix domain-containing protein n=1 Tax=Pseudomonas sp. TaxID=306 RepID=UPI0033940285